MRKLVLLAATLILTAPAFAQQADAPVSAERQQELRAQIYAATQAPDFHRPEMLLEVYRTLTGAGVVPSPAEAFDMGERARVRGIPTEAVRAYALLNSDDLEFRENTALIAYMQKQAEQDRQGGIDRSVEAARQRASAEALVNTAQAFASVEDHERAVELYKFAIDRQQPAEGRHATEAETAAWASAQAKASGRSISFYLLEAKQQPDVVFADIPYHFTPTELALAKLNYGISLFRLKRVAEARAMWSAIRGSPTVEILAKAWLDIADRTAN